MFGKGRQLIDTEQPPQQPQVQPQDIQPQEQLQAQPQQIEQNEESSSDISTIESTSSGTSEEYENGVYDEVSDSEGEDNGDKINEDFIQGGQRYESSSDDSFNVI